VPIVPGLSGGHCGFTTVRPAMQSIGVIPTGSDTRYVLYFLRIRLSGENGVKYNVEYEIAHKADLEFIIVLLKAILFP